MLEPTLFVGLEHQVHDRLIDLAATAAEVRPGRRPPVAGESGLLRRTRGTVGRLLVSLGTSVAGQQRA